MDNNSGQKSGQNHQLCGFKIGDAYYAVPVLEVQELIKPQRMTQVPLSPPFVRGLINLRGQIVTTISLRRMFGIDEEDPEEHMNIIIRNKDSLYSLIVDEIMDVMDLEESIFESAPKTINEKIRKYIKGVYKLDGKILVLLDLAIILNEAHTDE